MSNDEDIIYIEEDLPEIEYYELVSLEEIVKNNPTFIAFSREEIYNELFNFLKKKNKTECFLNLFYEIINKKTNVNNFIVVADAKKTNFEDLEIDIFISELKKYDKLQPSLALKSKSKLWFPLEYDTNSTKLRFTATQKTTIELIDNDSYIVFKDDETNIPVMGVYFYSPDVINEDYLNNKIMSGVINKREKLQLVDSSGYTDFDELVKNYKIPIPINKIDEDDYNYSSINNLLHKYNYNLDNISSDDLDLIKGHLNVLNQKEKDEPVKLKPFKIKSVEIINPRYTFFNILKDIRTLIDDTLISEKLDEKSLQKTNIEPNDFTKNLNNIINHINEANYESVIKILRDIRKNISIDNILEFYKKNSNLNKKNIIIKLNDLETKFELLKFNFRDIYDIKFSFKNEEHELEIGNDEKKYEGIPNKIGNFNNIDDMTNEEDDDNNDNDDLFEEKEFKKYYENYYYKIETGFIELLKFILPFINKLEKISKLPLNYDVLVGHLFNKYRTFDSKITVIKKHIPNIDDVEIENINKKTMVSILLNLDENKEVKNAIYHYFSNLMDVVYDIIAYWSIYIQNEVLQETLFFNPEKCSPECIHLWEEYGSPYDISAKTGILPYIICIFNEVYNDIFKNKHYDVIKMNENYKTIINKKLIDDYGDELDRISKIKIKTNKENIGRKYYQALKTILENKDYKNDTFFKSYIDALIYMPTLKFVKIHKYLQGCCLEKIDENFTADLYLRTERKDLKKAKEKFASKRVFNEPRAKRFFIQKPQELVKIIDYTPIQNEIKYDIIDIKIEDWLKNIKSNKNTIFTKTLIDALLQSTYKATENYKELYITYFSNSKDLKNHLNNNNFNNYRQIILAVSKVLFKILNEKSEEYITTIINTLNELDKLNSIIDDDNIKDIINIRRVAIMRIMALPSRFEDVKNKTFIPPTEDISRELFTTINKEIVKEVINVIKISKMFNYTEQVDFINTIREKNKADILSKMNKKTRDEKDMEKELKKYGLQIKDDIDENDNDDMKPIVNKQPAENSNEIDGEYEYNIGEEDDMNDDDMLDGLNYGFIYAD
jgi:hypothetical protein